MSKRKRKGRKPKSKAVSGVHRITVSIPNSVRKAMIRYKKRLNFSRVASSALKKAINDLQLKDKKRSETTSGKRARKVKETTKTGELEPTKTSA